MVAANRSSQSRTVTLVHRSESQERKTRNLGRVGYACARAVLCVIQGKPKRSDVYRDNGAEMDDVQWSVQHVPREGCMELKLLKLQGNSDMGPLQNVRTRYSVNGIAPRARFVPGIDGRLALRCHVHVHVPFRLKWTRVLPNSTVQAWVRAIIDGN